MTKRDIIDDLAKKKTVERLIKTYSLASPYYKDLAQDIYIELLGKKDELICSLHKKGEFEYYVRKMIKNNVNSTTSPFWKNYERFRKTTTELQNETEKDE